MDLSGAVFVIWAVILVNDNGVVDIIHGDILKHHISHEPFACSPPRLYSHAILCLLKSYSSNSLPRLPMLHSLISYYKIQHAIDIYIYTHIINNEVLELIHLMPCPRPHTTFSIHKLVAPGPIDTQSSPVLILVLEMVTPVEC